MQNNLVLRTCRGEEELPILAAILTASENADQLPVQVTAEELGEMLHSEGQPDLTHDLVVAEVDGQVVGYGRVTWWQEEPPRMVYSLTGYLLPERRRKGIGQAVQAWLEERARTVSAGQSSEIPCFWRVNATQYQVGLHALLQQRGYQPAASWSLMVRPILEEIPHTPLPAGLELRPALPEHYADIWYAVCEAYQPETGLPPSREMPEWVTGSPNFQPDLWQVAWDTATGKVAGSVMTYIDHMENRQLGIRRGFTEGISTVPAWQGRGVARALIACSLHVLREAGMHEAALVVDSHKPGNCRLYESCGFREVKRDTVYEKRIN